MTITLARLQDRFANELRYIRAETENPCLIDSEIFSPDERLQIYRNNFVIGLSDILQATYPVTEALVGEECFKALARKHILTNPLNEGDVSGYGADFSRTIELVETVSQSLPYLMDIAKLEFAFDSSRRDLAQARPEPLARSLQELSGLTQKEQENVLLLLKPGVIALHSEFAIYSIYNGIKTGRLENIKLSQPQSVLIYSYQQNQSDFVSVSYQAYSLIRSIAQGLSLSGIIPEYLNALDEILSFDVLSGFTLTVNQEGNL